MAATSSTRAGCETLATWIPVTGEGGGSSTGMRPPHVLFPCEHVYRQITLKIFSFPSALVRRVATQDPTLSTMVSRTNGGLSRPTFLHSKIVGIIMMLPPPATSTLSTRLSTSVSIRLMSALRGCYHLPSPLADYVFPPFMSQLI